MSGSIAAPGDGLKSIVRKGSLRQDFGRALSPGLGQGASVLIELPAAEEETVFRPEFGSCFPNIGPIRPVFGMNS
jgi:hypothetical protein